MAASTWVGYSARAIPVPARSANRVSLKSIAEASGHAVATVSYALRDDAKIPESTRRKIQAVADKLGYRLNPRVSHLMAYVRGHHHMQDAERLAFVWMHTSRAIARSNPFLRTVFEGASRRAQQTGFGLVEFFTTDAGMTDRRLEQILRSRGIVGVVLSPVTTNEATLTLKWNWSAFAPAVIGNVAWTPELHHAGHHHFLGMQTTLAELAKTGVQRPAAIIEAASNTRAKRAWEAAFLMHHPASEQARQLIRVPSAGQTTGLANWVRRTKADALIVSAVSLLQAPGLRAACAELQLPIVTLYWEADTPEYGGVDQCYDRIAEQAVDLVIAQLNTNETGVPDLPRMMLFPGRWVAPVRPTASARR